MDKISYQQETITPNKAEQILSKNQGNRPLSPCYVKRLSEQMVKGKWRLTHQGIAIDKAGNLLDGQHRLSAVVESGKPQIFMVARNVDRETFSFVDRPRVRSGADVLSDVCYNNRTLTAAVTRLFKTLIEGNPFGNSQKYVDPNEIYDTYVKYKKIIDPFIEFATPARAASLAALAFCSLAFRKEALDFATQLKEGANLAKDNPILRLREWLFRIKGQGGDSIQKDEIRFLLSAFKAHVDNRKLQQLRGSETAYDLFYNKVVDAL